jgi:hypothetical protein
MSHSCANLLLRQLRLEDAAALLVPRLGSAETYGSSEVNVRYQHARLLTLAGDDRGAEVGFEETMGAAASMAVPLALGDAWFGKAIHAEARGDLETARDCTSGRSTSTSRVVIGASPSTAGCAWCASESGSATSTPRSNMR